jgi:hypothetical protein
MFASPQSPMRMSEHPREANETEILATSFQTDETSSPLLVQQRTWSTNIPYRESDLRVQGKVAVTNGQRDPLVPTIMRVELQCHRPTRVLSRIAILERFEGCTERYCQGLVICDELTSDV